MPLGRYFLFMGALLLALLFVADWYLPCAAAPAVHATVDHSVIRLHSRHRWPEKIVIDTSLSTIVPPATAESLPPASPPIAGSAREAMALAMPAAATATAPAIRATPKRRARPVRATRYVAERSYSGFNAGVPAGW